MKTQMQFMIKMNSYTNSKPLLDLQNLEENQIDLTSLSGNKMSPNEFTHNNMVPYFGGKIRGRGANLNQAEGLLDNKMGIGSQVFKKKNRLLYLILKIIYSGHMDNQIFLTFYKVDKIQV